MSELLKTATIKPLALSEADLAKINSYTLEPLKAEEVFAFNLMAGDNGKDDRNHEPFTTKALEDMAALYKGRPVIWDHGRGASGTRQTARVFDAYTKQTDVDRDGEKETQLILRAYMLNSEANQALIADIKAGIIKEVSTGCYPSSVKCSICGADQMKGYCRHWPGRSYNGEKCLMSIEGVKDVLEVSFVGKPAQVRAGVTKSYNPNLHDACEEDFKEEVREEAVKTIDEMEVAIKERELYLMIASAEGDTNE